MTFHRFACHATTSSSSSGSSSSNRAYDSASRGWATRQLSLSPRVQPRATASRCWFGRARAAGCAASSPSGNTTGRAARSALPVTTSTRRRHGSRQSNDAVTRIVKRWAVIITSAGRRISSRSTCWWNSLKSPELVEARGYYLLCCYVTLQE